MQEYKLYGYKKDVSKDISSFLSPMDFINYNLIHTMNTRI